MKTSPSTNRIVWLDVTRFMAMFLLVCCHCADPFNFYSGSGSDAADIKFWGAVYGSAFRPCVPLFVMITGALLLPVKQDIGYFYKHRISRVFFPFIIWSILYNVFPWVMGVLGQPESLVKDLFPCIGPELSNQSAGSALERIVNIPLNFTYIAVQMWYIYLLIGLYLYMPIFSAWIEKASEKAKLWFLVAWGVTLFLPYYLEFAEPYIWGTCSWNAFGMLYYFAGFNGYLLLGHYLRHHECSWGKVLGFGIPMFALGYAITFTGYRHMTQLPNATEPMMELFFTYNSPNVVLMTIPLFWFSKKITVNSLAIRRILQNLTLCGFGIYMIHYFFVGPTFFLTRWLGVPSSVHIPVAAIFAFGISWLIIAAIQKALGKKAKYFIG